jgi:glycosyltransferase involved in cell wall biosynthesis
MLDLSIVIPAYKEERKIVVDVAAADAFLRASGIHGEILVVDDGSPDGTAAAARRLQPQFHDLRVVSYTANRGKGHAIAQGVMQARGDIVMFADAGLCVPFDIAALGIAMIKLDMCDIAHGSRRARGSVVKAQPLYRRLGSKAYAFVVHAVMGIPSYISDTQCGFKMYRREVALGLYSELVTDGFMFDVEVIMRALRQRRRILEFPVLWSNDADTRYDPVKGTLRNLRELARIRWTLATESADREELRAARQALREDVSVT